MEGSVYVENIGNTYIDEYSLVGEGTRIYPNCRVCGSAIGKNCTIDSGCILENCTLGDNVSVSCSVVKNSSIGANTTVGPFANVHSGSVIGENCRIGNFVEIKNSRLGSHTKAAHLAYVGDVDTGSGCNIGCGVIFVNYDGAEKHRCSIGSGVFVGSNCNIVAPVTIADGAYIAAGTTVTEDLPKDSFCIGRSRCEVKIEARKRYLPH